MSKFISFGNLIFKKELIRKVVIHNNNVKLTYLKPRFKLNEFRYYPTEYNFYTKKIDLNELYTCPNILIEKITEIKPK